jgi:dihydrofolate synthase/folylpolyglutamate synthase
MGTTISENQTLQDKVNRLFTLRSSKVSNKTNAINPAFLRVLGRLGDPQMTLPPVIHIAGTNGKGSVSAALNNALSASGHKVHLYTSPHLLRFNERFIIAGETVKDDQLEMLIDTVDAAARSEALNFFEFATAMAFHAFSESKADITILETGVGGRLDCTNVIDRPVCSLITSISFDHTECLGDTLAKIAYEKAGIIKKGSPCVVSPQPYPLKVIPVLQNRAQELGCRLFLPEKDWGVHAKDSNQIEFYWEDSGVKTYNRPNLLGSHQIENIGTALCCLHVIKEKFPTKKEAINQALSTINWRGRLQKLPNYKKLELWVDGAHNEGAAIAVSRELMAWKKKNNEPIHLIVSMMKRKQPEKFLAPFFSICKSITFVPLDGYSDAFTSQELKEKISEKNISRNSEVKIYEAPSLKTALENISENHPEKGHTMITGSLYLVSKALQELS